MIHLKHLKQLVLVVLFASIASTAACGVDQPGSAEADPCAEVGPDGEPLAIGEAITAELDGSDQAVNAPNTAGAANAAAGSTKEIDDPENVANAPVHTDLTPAKQCVARCSPDDVGCSARLDKPVGTKLAR